MFTGCDCFGKAGLQWTLFTTTLFIGSQKLRRLTNLLLRRIHILNKKPFYAYQNDILKNFAVLLNAVVKRIDWIVSDAKTSPATTYMLHGKWQFTFLPLIVSFVMTIFYVVLFPNVSWAGSGIELCQFLQFFTFF